MLHQRYPESFVPQWLQLVARWSLTAQQLVQAAQVLVVELQLVQAAQVLLMMQQHVDRHLAEHRKRFQAQRRGKSRSNISFDLHMFPG
jgi:hypothetical protein